MIAKRDHNFFWGSFRFRIFFLLMIMGLLPLLAGSEMIKRSYRSSIIDQKLSELRYTCQTVAGQMSGNSLAEAVDDEMTRELNFLAEYCGGRLLLVDSSYRILFDTYGVTQNKYCISEQIIDTFSSRPYEHYSQKTEYLELAVPLRTRTILTDGDDSITGVLLLSSSGAWIAKMINSMNRQVLLIEITGSMILFALSFIFAWTSSTPWKNLVTTLNQVLDGNLDVTFSTEGGYNETKEIINTFNQVLERLRLIDQSRQEFVSNVSHELKTPITSMRVLADSLISGDNVPVDIYREFMQDISDEIDRETKIINDLLTLVRMDKNATELNISQVNINNLVEQILKRVRPIAKTRSIEIIFESFRPVTADVDETKLSLAVTNLVENGVKYNNDGGWVRVSVNADHKYFYIKVSDSGVGIPKDAQTRIYERFYRVDKARSRETGGTGLGLSIVKSFVELMNGRIHVESEPGKGTRFTVEIPLELASEEDICKKELPEQTFMTDKNIGKRILLAEDNELNAEIAMELLKEEGFLIDWVKDGQECFDKLEESDEGYYDLILMDIQMPILNGYDTTAKIRQMENPKKAATPIVAMTANAFEEDIAMTQKVGMNGFIAKPLDAEKMFTILKQSIVEN